MLNLIRGLLCLAWNYIEFALFPAAFGVLLWLAFARLDVIDPGF